MRRYLSLNASSLNQLPDTVAEAILGPLEEKQVPYSPKPSLQLLVYGLIVVLFCLHLLIAEITDMDHHIQPACLLAPKR